VREPNAAWERERLLIVVLNRQQQIMAAGEIPPAGVTAARLRAVFKGVRLTQAGGLIGVHNRPGANPRSLESDAAMMRRLKRLASEFGVPLIDHVVFSRGRYHSTSDLLARHGTSRR
jgi:DNA repair protein RadC